RAHRIGQTKTVTYVDLVTPRTVDEKIVQALVRKNKLALGTMGGEWRGWIEA
ncbi:MAG: ATP-dependent helicase, partial [Brevundimonas sp.]|nr:ATP-dependent helicase [Brevundimonas sp.]